MIEIHIHNRYQNESFCTKRQMHCVMNGSQNNEGNEKSIWMAQDQLRQRGTTQREEWVVREGNGVTTCELECCYIQKEIVIKQVEEEEEEKEEKIYKVPVTKQ